MAGVTGVEMMGSEAVPCRHRSGARRAPRNMRPPEKHETPRYPPAVTHSWAGRGGRLVGMPPAWRRRRLSPFTQTPEEVHALKLLASNPRLRIGSRIAPRHRRLAVVRAFNRAWACSCQCQGGLHSGNRAQTRGCSKQRVLHSERRQTLATQT